MRASHVFILFLVLAALGTFLYVVFSPVDVAEEGEYEQYVSERVQQPMIEPIIADEPAKEIWTTSKRLFTVEIPVTFEIDQKDAGSASSIIVTDPEDSEKTVEIFLGLASSFEGVPVSLDTWINEQLLQAVKIEDCDDEWTFDDAATICFKTTSEDGRVREMYFGNADTLTHYYIAKDIEEFSGTLLQGVFRSINFTPTRAELSRAKIIQ